MYLEIRESFNTQYIKQMQPQKSACHSGWLMIIMELIATNDVPVLAKTL